MNNLTSKKSFAISFTNGKWELLRVPFGTELAQQLYPVESYPDHDYAVHNPKYTLDSKWETSNLFDMYLPEGMTYGEVSFSGSDRDNVRAAAGELARISGAFVGGASLHPELFPGIVPDGLPNAERHYVLHGEWRDDGSGTAIVMPARFIAPDGRRVRTLSEMIGLTIHIRTKSDRLKARKYMKRLMATHRWAVPGEFGEERTVLVHEPTEAVPINLLGGERHRVGYRTGQAVDVRFGSVSATVLHVDLDQYGPDEVAAVDGLCYVSVDLLNQLGEEFDNDELRNYEVGDAFTGTWLAKDFFGKGIWHVREMDGDYQIIVYGPKKQLEFEHVFLGCMTNVKGSLAFTEIQSMLSFLSFAPKARRLWIELAQEYMLNVRAAIHDEDMLRHLFLTNIAPMADMLESTDPEIWSLIEAIRHGVPILRNPGLFRRVVRHLMTTALQCKRGRIPYGEHRANRAYFQPDDAMVNFRTGHITVDNTSIGDDCVCCMDAPAGQWIVFYRQPLANNQEAVMAYNIGEDDRKRFRKFIGRGRIIMGRSVRKQLKAAGGADHDDSAVVLFDPKWVEVFSTVKPYPLAELPKAEKLALESDDESNPFITGGAFELDGRSVVIPGMERGLKVPRIWTLADCYKSCADAVEIHISIGPIDNAIRLDVQLSGDNKLHMLHHMAEDLKTLQAAGSDLVPAVLERFEWLLGRKDYQLNQIGSNEEAFIDNIKMGKGDQALLGRLNRMAEDVSNLSKVYPQCWTWMGRRGSRIPRAREAARDYSIAPSLLDETLNEINKFHSDLLSSFTEEEWVMAKPIPYSLDQMFPHNSAIGQFAGALNKLWFDSWQWVFQGQVEQSWVDGNRVSEIILNGGLLPLVNGTFAQIEGVRTKFLSASLPGISQEELQNFIAVEIARRTYAQTYESAPRNDRGTKRGYGDGLLWTNFMAQAYVRAMRAANLTGIYVPVKFDRHASNLRSKSMETLIMNAVERHALTQAGETITGRLLPERIRVKLIGGLVKRLSDGHLIGYTLDPDQEAPDGEYFMEDGLIVVRKASPELTGRSDDGIDEAGGLVLPQL
jgi:hypothetical protein